MKSKQTRAIHRVAPQKPRPTPEMAPAAIGERLELTRHVLGMKQNAFCEGAGISRNTYNQYERGKKRPEIGNAIALCETYGLTLDWIYRGDPSGLRYETADAIKSLRSARTARAT